ncbi:MAG: TetR/AcrR family transcriptional regulator [Nocardioidaceae bacterium]|nr:TetR/AcrR family transcriptional regulator [Nocardioidaceae bacterium]
MTSTPARLPSGEKRPRYDLDSLLAVAVTVFTERGYDGTSIEQLAQASGLSKSSIYHHVDSKEQLLRLALERALDPLLASTRERGATTGRAADRLRHMVRRDVQVLADRLPYVTLLLRVHGNTATERWAMGERRRFDQVVADLVQEAAADGDIRAGVDSLTVSRLIFGMVNSLVEWYRPGRDQDPGALADDLLSLVFDGIGTRTS